MTERADPSDHVTSGPLGCSGIDEFSGFRSETGRKRFGVETCGYWTDRNHQFASSGGDQGPEDPCGVDSELFGYLEAWGSTVVVNVAAVLEEHGTFRAQRCGCRRRRTHDQSRFRGSVLRFVDQAGA